MDWPYILYNHPDILIDFDSHLRTMAEDPEDSYTALLLHLNEQLPVS